MRCYRKILQSHTKTMLPTRKSVPRSSRTTRRSPDHRKETQTAVVWPCLPFIRSGQNHLARHSEREKKTRQTEEEVGKQHQRMDRPGVRQVPEGSGEKRKVEETGCEVPQRPSCLRNRRRWKALASGRSFMRGCTVAMHPLRMSLEQSRAGSVETRCPRELRNVKSLTYYVCTQSCQSHAIIYRNPTMVRNTFILL